MKKIAFITAALLAPTALLAQDEAPEKGKGKGPRGGRPVPAEILKEFDADGDGHLNKEERKAAQPAMKAHREAMIAKFDKDGDGKLNPEERKAAMVARFDADGDGTLNETEQAAADAAMARRQDRPEGKGPKGEKGGKGKRKAREEGAE